MRKDELNQPLKRRGVFERLGAKRPSLLQAGSALAFAAFAGAIGWLAVTPNPFGGEPVLMVAVPAAMGWMNVVDGRGPVEVERVYRELLAGKTAPDVGYLLTLNR